LVAYKKSSSEHRLDSGKTRILHLCPALTYCCLSRPWAHLPLRAKEKFSRITLFRGSTTTRYSRSHKGAGRRFQLGRNDRFAQHSREGKWFTTPLGNSLFPMPKKKTEARPLFWLQAPSPQKKVWVALSLLFLGPVHACYNVKKPSSLRLCEILDDDRMRAPFPFPLQGGLAQSP